MDTDDKSARSNPELKYALKRLSDYAEIPSTTFLIERYLPLGAQIVLAALPKTLKTYIALSWACCIATGLSWLGYTTRKGRVLYIALESFHGILRRQEAWRVQHSKSKADLDDLRFVTVPVNFVESNDILKVLADLAAQAFRPDFIVIDTWFKSTAGANVSDQAEMTKALEHLTALQKKLQEDRAQNDLPEVTIVIIAHTDKKGMDLFGSITQFANCDVLYMLKREPGATEATLSCTGTRDIEEPPDLGIGLAKVTIQTAKGEEQNLAVAHVVGSDLKQILEEPIDKDEEHGKQLVDLVLTEFQPKGATWKQLSKRWQQKNKEAGDAASLSTFKRGFGCCRRKNWLVSNADGKKGQRKQGQRYNLNPDGCWRDAVSDLGSGPRPMGSPLRGVNPVGPYDPRSMDPSWTQVGPLDPIPGCKSENTTAPLKPLKNSAAAQPADQTDYNARELAAAMRDIWDATMDGADYPQLRNRSGMTELICAPAFKYAVDKGWFIRGPDFDKDQKWHLNFSGSSGSSSPTESPPVQPTNVEGPELIKQAMEDMDEATKAKAKPSRPQ